MGKLRLLIKEMTRLTPQQERIFNAGERLIPGVTHDLDEEVRHRSSYCLFRKIIESDIDRGLLENAQVTILDLGCGTGHGSRELAEVVGSIVTGVDISVDTISFAKQNYSAANISYIVADMEELIAEMKTYDYVVSRHAVEHVPDGLNLCLRLKWSKRLMINVPYNESPGNEFHFVNKITKESFSGFVDAEFFYEDLKGVTHLNDLNPNINSIICVASSPLLSRVSDQLSFPIAAWAPNEALVQAYRINHLEARLVQVEARLQEIGVLPSVRIERKIRRMISDLFLK